MNSKMLPIGTVVQLAGNKCKVMICGRQQIDLEDNETYDYSGCEYPKGFDGENTFLFNADQIVMVYFIGYQDLDELHQRYILAEIIDGEKNRE